MTAHLIDSTQQSYLLKITTTLLILKPPKEHTILEKIWIDSDNRENN